MRGMRVPFWQQPCAVNVPTRSHELIMVMGAQRSGTNVLFSSLATDRTLSAFPEDIDSAFYCNFLLRPLSELAALIERAPGRILLKPINETGRRSLAELAEEYRSYRCNSNNNALSRSRSSAMKTYALTARSSGSSRAGWV